MKNNKIFTKLCCLIIGWNPSILAECGEASYRALKKYMSAITIMAIIWGTIGFLFADRYIGVAATYVKIIVSLIFITIVVCVERFIILKVGKSYFVGIMRIVLAFLMATLGATIFDQMIFKNDLDVKMTKARDVEANELLNIRTILINKQISENQKCIDSIGREYEQTLSEANAKPFITSVNTTQEQVLIGQDSLGNNIYERRTNFNKTQIPNPKYQQAQDLAKLRDKYIEQGQKLNKDLMELDGTIRTEMANKPRGFLEELKVLFREIIFKDKIAAGFYLILFLFMLSLELLVVSSKLSETTCDYDLIVEHQLKVKEATLRRTQEQLIK